MGSTRRSQRGQAAVETALTMPLALFVILGTLQLFLMLNGRIMAEYAAFRATRAGSVNVGDCRAMTHAAVAAVLPTFANVNSASSLMTAFMLRQGNMYLPGVDGTRFGAIVWIQKQLDRQPQRDIKDSFDDRWHPDSRIELVVDMVFWFPMKIPFANWVMARSYLAAVGAIPYFGVNPLSPAQNARWMKEGDSPSTSRVLGEMRNRAFRGQYDFPIRTGHRLRMMTPAVEIGRNCPNSPASL
ncbi:MAG: pilus assembly protein [Deltaproteobacteria bacterium]|nr:pilus assembly protein [Deltaproteobacteria bacterium]